MGTTYTLTEVAGVAAARELLLTGRTVEAPEMLRLGLCSAVFDQADLLEQALDRAGKIASAAPLATKRT